MNARNLDYSNYGLTEWRAHSKGDIRYELINGELYCMSPAPNISHQEISGKFYMKTNIYLLGKPCKVFYAPVDVYLMDGEDQNVVQPDILVVCDKNKLKKDGIHGAPDLIIEILSRSTSGRDLKTKLALYERFGVKEYLIVDGFNMTAFQHILVGNKYTERNTFTIDDDYISHALDGLTFPLADIFEDI